jgi:hypothetical protein
MGVWHQNRLPTERQSITLTLTMTVFKGFISKIPTGRCVRSSGATYMQLQVKFIPAFDAPLLMITDRRNPDVSQLS